MQRTREYLFACSIDDECKYSSSFEQQRSNNEGPHNMRSTMIKRKRAYVMNNNRRASNIENAFYYECINRVTRVITHHDTLRDAQLMRDNLHHEYLTNVATIRPVWAVR